MPDTTPVNSNKGHSKPRLGRGLGSLLGAAVEKSADEVLPTQSTTIAPATGPKTAGDSAVVTAAAAKLDAGALATPTPTPTTDEARIWQVPVEKLKPNAQQPRQIFEEQSLRELSASIKEQGILQPITARRTAEGEFEIIAGERRWRAAQLAGLKQVPVILKTAGQQKTLEWAILENIQRADLNPIEEAEAYDALMKEYGMTQAQVAERLGKERSTVANALRLLVLPPEVKLMIGGGSLSAGHAKVLLGLDSMSEQIELAKESVREKLSVRALERKVSEKKAQLARPISAGAAVGAANVSSKLVEALASELQKLIGTRVVIDYADRRGKLGVYFHSDEQLTEIVERMRRGWAKPTPVKPENPIGSFRA